MWIFKIFPKTTLLVIYYSKKLPAALKFSQMFKLRNRILQTNDFEYMMNEKVENESFVICPGLVRNIGRNVTKSENFYLQKLQAIVIIFVYIYGTF